jgi:putative pyruvate formate lyase activating enzyme
VLPGYIENSISVLRYIAEEISPEVHISLMSQYNPINNVSYHPFLKRKPDRTEYDRILEEMHKLGFENGWVQDLESAGIYNPDFNEDEPFNSIISS